MPVTIRDVARKLDLSVTTVSRALAGYDDVADSTRARVIATAQEMGYVPSHAARQLRRQRTETLGLVFPTMGARFSDPFFSEFIAGIGDETSQLHYDLLVSVAAPGELEESTYHRNVNSRRVDGFILSRVRIADWRIEYLTEVNFPFVAFGRSETPHNSPHIGVDGFNGMRKMVWHLHEQGFRQIAYIGAPDNLTLARDRFNGYLAGLEETQLPYTPDLFEMGDLTRAGGYEAAHKLLQHSPSPDAIIGSNDLTALGAMKAAQSAGLTIGVDIAISGFDGIEAGEHSHPPLTTVHQPVYDIGRQVTRMLVSIIEGEQPEELQQLIKPEIIIRESTDLSRHTHLKDHKTISSQLNLSRTTEKPSDIQS